MTDALMNPSKEICLALNNAYTEWKNISCLDGKKYIYFEHHCAELHGCTFVYDYNTRTFHSWRIIDEHKYMLFLLKYIK